ncbi:uncharacterized protein LOC132742211 isoform X2 [Ruditapes philippinarum]|uniref:uncharacterized protein LOC132742211 isoform X2 n=1 Tax=Ruditapes philippinarum TaxID=129788 RepID=UPI00295AB683|nr:uncharacterized protein LOC132742211 isoform X2 [Ruditapes philippinarum]
MEFEKIITKLMIILKLTKYCFTINADIIPDDIDTSLSGFQSNVSINYGTKQSDNQEEGPSTMLGQVGDLDLDELDIGIEKCNFYTVNKTLQQNVNGTLINSNNSGERQKYSIQIPENYTEIFVQHAKIIGLFYVERIVSNIHLFEYANKTGKLVDIKKLKALISSETKVIAIERYTTATVIVKVPDESRKLNLPLQRNKRNFEENVCFPYYDEDTYKAQRLGYTGRGVTVAVVDNGVNVNHPDLTNSSSWNYGCRSYCRTN